MAPADALSRQDLLDTSLNTDTAICPEPMIINALDLALTQHIKSSSLSDPLAIESLQKGSSLFACSSLMDWKFKKGHPYFKGCMYIPPESMSMSNDNIFINTHHCLHMYLLDLEEYVIPLFLLLLSLITNISLVC